MFECNYSREPVDFKLLWLRMLRKIWLIPVSIIAGAALVCGFYLCVKLAIMGRSYTVENIYYIDFAEDSSGKQYDWVNQYTWSSLADMNVFIDEIYADLSGEVSKEVIRNSSDCTVEADGRYLYMRVTTKSEELSMKISGSYEKALFSFCKEHKEFKNIVCEHKGEVFDSSNLRITELSIVGAVVGLFVYILIFSLAVMSDTAVYIPSTLEKRYHIVTLGCQSMPEFNDNCSCLLKDAEKVALVYVDKEQEKISIPGKNVEVFENPCVKEGLMEGIRACSGAVVFVKAGVNNGKMTERVLEQLSRHEVKVLALALVGEDLDYIKRYY